MAGIDQQIEQRKMQFRGNPQALQQRYGQSKQLLDLLALQQIATEQKQKAQAMQMQMQQNPATVAQQVEQEVLQGKKAEMAQALGGMQAMRAPKRGQTETARGVAGALAQRQREKQSRMQRMADSGVASQPARNMERMYDGGIVGFQAGDYVTLPGASRPTNITQDELDYYMRQNPELSRDQAIEALSKKGRALRMADTFFGKKREASAAARRERRAQDEVVQEERRQQQSKQRAIDEGYDVEGLDLTGIELPEQRKPFEVGQPPAPSSALTTAAPTEPGLMERKAQQKQELLAAGEDILGSPAVGPLEARRSVGVPDLLRAREEPPAPAPAAPAEPKQLTRQEQLYDMLMENMRKQGEALTTAEEDLKSKYSGRSRGQKILDRLITAAQMQAQGAPARTNRQALARLLGGYTVASGQERKAEEEGLARLAERRKGITEGQLGLATGLAQIKRGEALTEQGARGLDIQEAQGARRLDLEAERIGVSREQLEQAARTAANDLGFKYSKLKADTEKATRMASIAEEGNKIQREFNNARTEQAKQNLLAKYEQLIFDYDDAIDAALVDEIEAIRIAPNIDAADRPGEIDKARKRAAEVKRKRRGMLRAMQEQATGVDVGSLRPTVGESVDEELSSEAQSVIDKYK